MPLLTPRHWPQSLRGSARAQCQTRVKPASNVTPQHHRNVRVSNRWQRSAVAPHGHGCAPRRTAAGLPRGAARVHRL